MLEYPHFSTPDQDITLTPTPEVDEVSRDVEILGVDMQTWSWILLCIALPSMAAMGFYYGSSSTQLSENDFRSRWQELLSPGAKKRRQQEKYNSFSNGMVTDFELEIMQEKYGKKKK